MIKTALREAYKEKPRITMTTSAPVSEFYVGERIVLIRLERDQHLNGQSGTVIKYRKKTERYIIKLDKNSQVLGDQWERVQVRCRFLAREIMPDLYAEGDTDSSESEMEENNAREEREAVERITMVGLEELVDQMEQDGEERYRQHIDDTPNLIGPREYNNDIPPLLPGEDSSDDSSAPSLEQPRMARGNNFDRESDSSNSDE